MTKRLKSQKKIDDKPLLISLYQNLSDLTMRQKKFEAALDFYKLSVVYKDSLNSAENRKASVQKEMQYEFDKKQTADSLKVVEERKTTSLKLKHEAYRRNFLYVGLVGVLVFVGFIFNRFRITQKQKQIIEEQKRIVDDKQKEILDSIRYAKRIQQALLPNQKYISKFLKK